MDLKDKDASNLFFVLMMQMLLPGLVGPGLNFVSQNSNGQLLKTHQPAVTQSSLSHTHTQSRTVRVISDNICDFFF